MVVVIRGVTWGIGELLTGCQRGESGRPRTACSESQSELLEIPQRSFSTKVAAMSSNILTCAALKIGSSGWGL